MEELIHLPIVRYTFSFKVIETINFPEYAGSMLRGAFGRALRKISCMTKLQDCKVCPLYRSCPYPAIFETPAPEFHPIQNFSQVPNAYIIEPPAWGSRTYNVGDLLIFNLVLYGQVLNQLPLITYAWQRAFNYQVGKGKAELIDICYINNEKNSISVYQAGRIIEHPKMLAIPNTLISNMDLKLLTPMRLQANGRALSVEEISLERMIIGLAKRIILLSEFHSTQTINIDFTKLKNEIAMISEQKHLSWRNWIRYSSRQKQKMQLGGVIGDWQLFNISPQIQKLLFLGQWLHCGKNASFGLGKYQITNLYSQ